VGAADSRPRAARPRQGGCVSRAVGDELRRAEPARARAWRARPRAHAVPRACAVRQLRHGGGDERHPGRPGVHTAGQDRQVRRVLPRSRGCVPGQGRLGRDHPRHPDEPGGSGSRDGRHAPRALQRSRFRGRRAPGSLVDDCRDHR
jgi:hypothetical protein